MSLGNKIFIGVLWSAVENVGVKLIQFLIGILLARILSPQEYGIIGILMVFIMISNIFIDSGFTKALIQKKNRTNEDINTVFLFNIVISIFFYFLLYISSPIIETFYNIDSLSLYLRILAITLITNAAFTLPITLLTIKLDFKSLSKINMIGSIVSGAIAVFFALKGYGVWSLIIQTLCKSFITLILVHIRINWKPKLIFSILSFKTFFSYGSNLLVSSILNRVVNDMSALVIAKQLNVQSLGFYTRGAQFSDFVSSTVSTVIDRVILPGLSDIQENAALLINHTKQILKFTALLVIPIFFGLFILAEPIIIFLLTDKWIMAVPIMKIFCLARLVTILSGISINLLYVIGKPNLALRQQYVKIPIRIVLLLISLKYGIIYIALGELISTILHFFINTHYPGKIMNYGASKQIKDLSFIFIAGAIMATSIHFLIRSFDSNILKLTTGLISGIIIYSGLIFFFEKKLVKSLLLRIRKLKK